MSVLLFLAAILAAYLPMSSAERARSWRIDDFEDGDRVASTGLSWMALSDAIRGGSSTAELDVVGRKGERALRLKGTLGKDGFGSAWVALDQEARAVDLRAFTAVRVTLRGEGEWQVGLRGGPDGAWDNFMAPVAGSSGWTTVEVPLTDLKARPRQGREPSRFDAANVRWVGVQSGSGRTGAFTVEVDELELVGAGAPAGVHGFPAQTRTALAPPRSVDGATWRALGTERAGDAKMPALPDVVGVSSWTSKDVVWFRVELAAPVGSTFGVNLVLDLDGDPANGMAWWGANKDFHFDRLVTAYVMESTATSAEGVFGVANADAIRVGRMMEPSFEKLRVVAVPGRKAIEIGVPRSVLGGSAAPHVVVAVGSAMQHNDDLPDTGYLTLASAD